MRFVKYFVSPVLIASISVLLISAIAPFLEITSPQAKSPFPPFEDSLERAKRKGTVAVIVSLKLDPPLVYEHKLTAQEVINQRKRIADAQRRVMMRMKEVAPKSRVTSTSKLFARMTMQVDVKGLIDLKANPDVKSFAEDILLGGGYAQCEDRAKGRSDGSQEIDAAVNQLIPEHVEVNCVDKELFALNGEQVHFVYIAYGETQDCPSGCFSSFVCAVVDRDRALLFSSYWSVGESPLPIPSECVDIKPDSPGDIRARCKSPPSGFNHPVTKTQAFKDFKASTERNKYRWCFK